MVNDESNDRNDIDEPNTDDVDDDPSLVEDDTEDNYENRLQSLRKKLKECEREKAEYLEELQRTKAEFLNSKRRLEEQKQRDVERATEAHITALLPVLDSFDLAMQDTAAWEQLDPSWRKGMEGVYAQLRSVLRSYGVETFGEPGEPFDPNRHEAMSTVAVSDAAAHDTVVSVMQPGIVRRVHETETLLRPARVTVGSVE